MSSSKDKTTSKLGAVAAEVLATERHFSFHRGTFSQFYPSLDKDGNLLLWKKQIPKPSSNSKVSPVVLQSLFNNTFYCSTSLLSSLGTMGCMEQAWPGLSVDATALGPMWA